KEKITKKSKEPKGTCFHCGKDGHWKRNCKDYLASLKNKPSEVDSGASQHICNCVQRLVGSRRLGKGEMVLTVGNGTKVAAKAVGTYHLNLPSGETLKLNNYPQPVVTQTPRISSRVRRMPERYYGFLHENEGELNLLSDCKDIEDPLNYNEAMSDIDSQKWLGAMKSEIDSMYTNQVGL
ncbi:unnamed protein product, partial [Prunus brigantina]